MRREHITERSYIDWLKSLGCLVYMPMSEDGDLLDRISGVTAQTTGDGSVSWDNNRNGYVLKTPSSLPGKRCLFLGSNFNKELFPNDEFSVLQTVEMITKTSGKGVRTIAPLSSTDTTMQALSAAYNASGNCSAWPDGYRNVAVTIKSSQRCYYQDGGLFNTYGGHAPYLPSNWTTDDDGLCIGTGERSTYTKVQFSVKNVYVFKTILDLTTIRKIQGYE